MKLRYDHRIRPSRDQLRTRPWVCDRGAVRDRDQNAEYNLRAEGRRLLAAGLAER
ncbi:hypothetical protein GCM10022233_51730 [Streptomyces shaanxiensis]|uniref:Transposase n=1 Tax=Streptomyces shaanxiensis TaxID=653357 RepID=A0ABP7VKL6_9ACTN